MKILQKIYSLTDGRTRSPNEEVLFYLVMDTSQCFRAMSQQWCDILSFRNGKKQNITAFQKEKKSVTRAFVHGKKAKPLSSLQDESHPHNIHLRKLIDI